MLNIQKDTSGVFVEAGCYPYFYLNGGSRLKNGLWVDQNVARHVVSRLRKISSRFEIQEERNRVADILEELDESITPFDECIRFPRDIVYVQLEQDDYEDILKQIALGASYKEPSSGSSRSQTTSVAPDQSDSPINKARKTYAEGVSSLAKYIRGKHAHSRITFELSNRLKWVNNGKCCVPTRAINYCEDVIDVCQPMSFDEEPEEPGKMPQRETHPASLLKLVVYENETELGTIDISLFYLTHIEDCSAAWVDSEKLSDIDNLKQVASIGYLIRDGTESPSDDPSALVYSYNLNNLNIRYIGNKVCPTAYLPWENENILEEDN